MKHFDICCSSPFLFYIQIRVYAAVVRLKKTNFILIKKFHKLIYKSGRVFVIVTEKLFKIGNEFEQITA